jgi:hypothetical protein
MSFCPVFFLKLYFLSSIFHQILFLDLVKHSIIIKHDVSTQHAEGKGQWAQTFPKSQGQGQSDIENPVLG